jgi:SnoaL-like domain
MISDAYFLAVSAGTRQFAGQTLMEWGQYHDTWRMTDDGWRIVQRDYRMDIQQGPLGILYATAPPDMWREGDARRLDGKR